MFSLTKLGYADSCTTYYDATKHMPYRVDMYAISPLAVAACLSIPSTMLDKKCPSSNRRLKSYNKSPVSRRKQLGPTEMNAAVTESSKGKWM